MTGAAAFFDVDGTLVAGNIVRYYANLRTQGLHPIARQLWIAGFALRVPYYLVLDAFSRPRFQHAFYANYRGFGVEDLQRRARVHFEEYLESHLLRGAVARLREHQDRGDAVVLVTGSLRPLVEPVAIRLKATELIAAEMTAADGRYTGRLQGNPVAHTHKAAVVSGWIRAHGLDPGACSAYADSRDDLPMLEAVGHPGVVNPSGKLAQVARKRGWEICHWSRS